MSNIATVNKIIPFSNVDGFGNRLAIFFQSCPLKCTFCHNPETINMCNNCGACIKTCPVNALSIKDDLVIWNKEICINCDACIKICPHSSSPKTTKMSVEDVLSEINKVKHFIRGITTSGGECMNHASFLLDLFKEVKKLNLTCLIDSNGYYPFSEYQELITLSDGVMLDVKMVDENKHEIITGHRNKVILDNLNYLLSINKLVEVRCIMFPNMSEENLFNLKYVSNIIKDKADLKIINYRYFGVNKAGIEMFGKNSYDDESMSEFKKYAMEHGAKRIVVI